MRQQRRALVSQTAVANTDFSAGFTGTARLSAANTAARFNPANSAAWTVAAFVYPTELTPGTYYPYVRLAGTSAATDGWYIQRGGAANLFQVGYSNGTNYFNVDSTAATLNTWHFVIGTWFNTGASPTIEIRVYGPLGNLADTTNTGTGFVNAAATGALTLGGLGGGTLPGEAHIDKVGIWGRALASSAEADVLWNGGAGLTGTAIASTSLSDALYYWDLDESDGTASWPATVGGVALAQTGTVTRQARAGQ